MNTKSRLLVKHNENVIEMNTTFAKMMQNPLSDEYALLQKTRMENPEFTIRRRQIKTNPKKDTYKGLTYGYMENYISTHEPEDKVDAVLAEFKELRLISQCHGKRLRYPTIKKWFLAQYPEVALFGTEPVAEDESATRSPIPFNAAAPTEEVPEYDAASNF